ncbi:MAG: DUF1302 family protein [Bacteroidales bacterium]
MKTVNKYIVFLVLSIFIQLNKVDAQEPDISGYVRNYTGMLTTGSNDFSIVQNTLNLDITGSKGNIAFKANPYVYQYFDREIDFGIREAYLDLYLDKMDIRFGRQQIIWGKADGAFITDIVSPKDLSEFLLPDFEEIRMGVNALKVDYYIQNSSVEFVWIPVFSETKLPEQSSIWYPNLLSQDTNVSFAEAKEIDSNLENSEVFLKFSKLSSAIDFEIMAGYMWDDDFSAHKFPQIDTLTNTMTGIRIEPEYHRLGVAGGSFSTTLGGTVLRSEAAYYMDKHFSTENLINDGLIKKNYLHYLVGLDFSIAGITMSTQFIQEYILDYADDITNDEVENTMTILVNETFFRETLTLELFSYIGLNNADALVRPKLTYNISDGLDVLAGANLFFGDSGRFGQYDKNDMVFMKLKYSF